MKPSLALVMLLAVPVLAQQEPSEPPAPSDTVGNQTGEQETESQVPNTDTDQSSGVGATITNASHPTPNNSPKSGGRER